MKLVKMRWEGVVDTKAYLKAGEPKQDILTGQEFEAEEEFATALFKYDKKYVIIDGINDHDGRKEKKEKLKAAEKAARKVQPKKSNK